MNIQQLPNGSVLDMDSVHYIQTEFLRPTDAINSKLIIAYEHATIHLTGTKQEIIDTRNYIMRDIDRRVQECIKRKENKS